MELSSLFSAVRKTIEEEADRGYHVMSITFSRKFSAWATDIGLRYDCPVYYSHSLSHLEFILSLRGSPSDRHVNFYRVRHDVKS